MVRYFHLFTALLLASVSTLMGFSNSPPSTKRVAIIIDDLGNGLKGTDKIFSIKAPLTVAIMPLLRTSKEDAIRARKAGFEVILHLPMEFYHGKKSWLGPGAITTDMSTEAIKKQVRADLDSVPYAKGINNHMGSKATADERVVRAVLEVVKERNLFFVDSATSSDSKIIRVARELGVPVTKRDIFLDNINSRHDINRQLNRLIKRTVEKGDSIAIGHVGIQGDNTSRAIESFLPAIQHAGIQIVPVSSLLTIGDKNK
ncbi:divergent polysaccharide deacetylase family protein [Shimazuella sp. AN120528]|uniref:divergent polysaccharide deacetylase family protein n=1 Tax=Shimazuella soli TaxID=1892854 RepID=UPI001F0CFBB3|nr:divergent polysaccharide deacetylase family protein [Shimazuella soli]MCH5584622.1 divergent polysaccharide deacetylase family protein [Shimazuella soli]